MIKKKIILPNVIEMTKKIPDTKKDSGSRLNLENDNIIFNLFSFYFYLFI